MFSNFNVGTRKIVPFGVKIKKKKCHAKILVFTGCSMATISLSLNSHRKMSKKPKIVKKETKNVWILTNLQIVILFYKLFESTKLCINNFYRI